MALAFTQQTRPFAANVSASRGVPVSRKVVLCRAAKEDSNVASAVMSAALAASMVCSGLVAPAAFAKSTVGEDVTSALVQSGTPEAARPGNMKTNVPFQAPGSNQSPRGPGQEQGTTVSQVANDAARQIKKNFRDPDAAAFGVGKGPLVRDAEKMKAQPGKLSNITKNVSKEFQAQGPQRPAAPSVDKGIRGPYYNLVESLAGKKK